MGITSQDHIKNHTFATISDAESGSPSAGNFCHVSEVSALYSFVDYPSDPPDRDGIYVLNTALGGNTRWKLITILPVDQEYLNFYVGSTLDEPNVVVSSDGATITATVEKIVLGIPGGDIRYRIKGETATLDCTPAASIELPAGTDTAFVTSYLWINHETNSLETGISGFPSYPHARLAKIILASAARTAAAGPMSGTNHKNHVFTIGDNGHMGHINDAFRDNPATYKTGLDFLTTFVTATSVTVSVSAGSVRRVHRHSISAITDPATFYIKNDETTPYVPETDIYNITTYSDGTSIPTNEYFALVFWESFFGDDSKLFVNKPLTGFVKAEEARSDTVNIDKSIPASFTENSVLVRRVICQRIQGGINVSYDQAGDDLRIESAGGAGGGVGPHASGHINDDVDPIPVVTETTKGLMVPCDQATELSTTGSPNWVKAGFNQATPIASVDTVSETAESSSSGLLVSNPNGPMFDIKGDKTATFYGTPRTSGVLEAGEGLQPLASALYVQSRLQNLVTNGNGLLGNNYNFPTYTFDTAELHGGGGSFLESSTSTWGEIQEYIPVDPSIKYIFVFWGKSGDIGGGNYDADARHLPSLLLYDIDKLYMQQQHATKVTGSTDTTLAVDLNPNDTTITLTDATGWNNDGSAGVIAWYGYTNSKGFTYPDYTYTRNVSGNNTWSAGGITGNVITLDAPWTGPALSAGAAVRNTSYGGYKYPLGYLDVPQDWTRYETYLSPASGDSINRLNEFFAYCAFVKLTIKNNNFTTIPNNIRWSDISITSFSAESIESASATSKGVVDLDDQVLGAGNKTFQDNVYIGKKLTVNENEALVIENTGDTLYEQQFIVKVQRGDGKAYINFLTDTGDVLLRFVSRSLVTFTDAVECGYFQSGLPNGNCVFSGASATTYNRLAFIVSDSPTNNAGILFTDLTAPNTPPDGYFGVRQVGGNRKDLLITYDGETIVGSTIVALGKLHVKGDVGKPIVYITGSDDVLALEILEDKSLLTSGPRIVDTGAAITGDYTVLNTDKEIIYGNPTGSDKDWTLPASPTENGKRTYINASDTYSMILNGGEKKVAGYLGLYTIGPGLSETLHYTTAFGHTRI